MFGQWVLFFIFIGIFWLTRMILARHITRTQPPGPLGWPIVGHLPMLGKHPHIYLYKLWKEYGDVVQIQMGSRTTVVLNGYKACRDAMLKQAAIFAGRPDFGSSSERPISFQTYNERYKLHKRIFEKALKHLTGSFLNDVEETLNNEAKELSNELTSCSPQDPRESITGAIARVLFSLCFGLNIDHKQNQDYKQLYATARKFIEYNATGGNLSDLLPWLNVITFKAGYRRLKKVLQSQRLIVNKYIQSHLLTFEHDYSRDILDSLIQATNDTSRQDKNDTGLSDAELYQSVTSLITAGLSTVSTFLHWTIMYMAKYEECQKKAQKEIDDVLGNLNLIKYSDRVHVPYVQACIHEIMRITTINPNAVQHATIKDTTLHVYHIPKGTMVIPNLWSVSRDESLWSNPDTFDPDRFLTSNGSKCSFDQTKSEFVPVFGMGKRRCLGEQLARMEVFIFFVNLLKQCSIQMSDEDTLDFEPVFGLTLDPKPYKVLIKRRV